MFLHSLVIGVLLALPLSAFAGSTWTYNKCASTDWHRTGAKDAQKGRPSSRVSGYEEHCKAVGVEIDTSTYLAGYNSSVSVKCQPENGYQRGAQGDSMVGACATSASYKRAHEQGRQIRQERQGVGKQIAALDRDIADLELQLAALQNLNNRVDQYGSLPDIRDSQPVEELIRRLQDESMHLQDTRESFAYYADELESAGYESELDRPQRVVMRQQCEEFAYSSTDRR